VSLCGCWLGDSPFFEAAVVADQNNHYAAVGRNGLGEQFLTIVFNGYRALSRGSRDRNHTGSSYWSATPVLFPNFYNAVLTSGYRKDNISVMHNDRLRGSLVDFQPQRSCQLTGGDFGWPGCLDGEGQAIRA